MDSKTSSNHIIWFADPQCTNIDMVGGKGANLGRLATADLPVPPGFVIGTDAYIAHIAPVKDRIAATLERVDYENAEELEHLVEQIRHIIVDTDMPADVAAQIRTAYGEPRRGLCRRPVLRDGRGPRGRLLRRLARHLSRRPGARGGPRRGQARLGQPMDRTRGRLP